MTDSENLPPLGATVTLKDLGLRTTTDIEGRYKLSVGLPGKYILNVQKGKRVVSITAETGSQTDVQLI